MVTAGWAEQLIEVGVNLETNVPFGSRTTYRVGGLARWALKVESIEDMEALSMVLAESAAPPEIFVLGKGSNTLVADGVFEGLVITLGERFGLLEVNGEIVELGAGMALPVAARRLGARGVAGFSWAVGVPGSVGGGVRMNAGGHGHSIQETLVEACTLALGRDRVPLWRKPEALELGYRHSSIAANEIILSARFARTAGDPGTLKREMDEIVAWRRSNQPGGQNAGSVFTNPSDCSAGSLIEGCGLKGFRFKSAMVSRKHANFIQADPGGSANDVFGLMELVRDRVSAATGIVLHAEVRLVGFKV